MCSEYEAFYNKIAGLDVREVSMSALTSFRIGGPAKVVFVRSREELLATLRSAKELGITPFILGNGTNLLASDRGIAEPVICLREGFSSLACTAIGEYVVGAGYMLSGFARQTLKDGYKGLEWAAGIPGTVGGAIAMNAGAYGGEICQSLVSVEYIRDGELVDAPMDPSAFGYRQSPFCAPNAVVVSAKFALEADNGEALVIAERFSESRRTKQPLNYPSAGSTFKRPKDHFAGALIENAGLKGEHVGGAQVSTLHAGFIINTGGATCADVLELIRIIRKRVHEMSGIWLEPEIKCVGIFTEEEQCIY